MLRPQEPTFRGRRPSASQHQARGQAMPSWPHGGRRPSDCFSSCCVPDGRRASHSFPERWPRTDAGSGTHPKGTRLKARVGHPTQGTLIKPQSTPVTNGSFHTRPGPLPSSHPACLPGREAWAAPGHRTSTGLPDSQDHAGPVSPVTGRPARPTTVLGAPEAHVPWALTQATLSAPGLIR